MTRVRYIKYWMTTPIMVRILTMIMIIQTNLKWGYEPVPERVCQRVLLDDGEVGNCTPEIDKGW